MSLEDPEGAILSEVRRRPAQRLNLYGVARGQYQGAEGHGENRKRAQRANPARESGSRDHYEPPPARFRLLINATPTSRLQRPRIEQSLSSTFEVVPRSHPERISIACKR